MSEDTKVIVKRLERAATRYLHLMDMRGNFPDERREEVVGYINKFRELYKKNQDKQ